MKDGDLEPATATEIGQSLDQASAALASANLARTAELLSQRIS